MSTVHAYQLNREDVDRLSRAVLKTLTDPAIAPDEVDARDVFTALAEVVAVSILFFEDSKLGDREQWRESFDSMLCELLDDSDGVGL